MKHLLLPLLLIATLCSYANATSANDSSTVTDATSLLDKKGDDTIGANPAKATDEGKAGRSKKVKPGECHENSDGVTVCNDKDSSGNAKVNPKSGTSGSETTVTTGTGFEGSIDGIDSNDTVDLGSSNDATVSGNGGTVNTGGGSTTTVTNGTGGGDMTVNTPSGSTVTVPPGSSATVTT